MFGERLKSARKMAGLSLEQLAQQMGDITKQAINNYEKGKRKPDSRTVIMLSKALGVRPEYFFRKQIIDLGNFEYRKKVRLTKKEKERIEAKARDIISRYLEIENLLGENTVWENPLENFEIKKIEDVEEAALKLRKSWNLGNNAIPNLIETLEDNGIKVIYIDVNKDFDGLANFAGGIPIIIVNKKIEDTGRLRFTVAHELGHLLLKLDSVENEKEKEKYCHTFAGAFLIPKEQIIKEFGGAHRSKIALTELISIKEEYGISIQAIAKRLHQLGVIGDSSYKKFNIIVNKNNWRRKEPGEYKAKEKPERFNNLVHRAVAEGIITLSKAASLLNTTISNLEMKIELII